MKNSKMPVVLVKDLYKSFKLPHDQHSGVKQLLINVFKSQRGYETQHVLDNLSFEIYEGEFFGIVGRNGSGKSTLLKLLAGIYAPDSGLVQTNGSLTPFIELGVGFNPELTGRENVFMNGALLGFSRLEMEAMYDSIVDFAELNKFMDQKLKNYSSGMQVRLAFSIAIRAESDILLLDEVLAVGDEAFQQKCYNYFSQLKKQGKTVILVTHDMSSVERFCTRAMILNKGQIKIIGKPSEVANEYRQENITSNNATSDSETVKASSELNILLKSGDKTVDIIFDVKTDVPYHDYYIGLTLFKNDTNIGEINSSHEQGGENIAYHLDITTLNPGKYEVSAALFHKNDRSLLAICNVRQPFLVKGFDEIRGGGIKLDSNWTVN